MYPDKPHKLHDMLNATPWRDRARARAHIRFWLKVCDAGLAIKKAGEKIRASGTRLHEYGASRLKR